MKETKKKIISIFCLFYVAAALLAAVILAPRPGGKRGESRPDLGWSAAGKRGADQPGQKRRLLLGAAGRAAVSGAERLWPGL